jgi:DNA-binding response OmpR family regulator
MKTVLLIEDEDNLREFIADSLELFDFKVLKAATAIQGIELAHSGAPDIILCDISLPGMDGYGVLKTLHESPQTIAIPFIFLTARSERDDIRKGMALGADDYITKPFGIDELIESITAFPMNLLRLSTLCSAFVSLYFGLSRMANRYHLMN